MHVRLTILLAIVFGSLTAFAQNSPSQAVMLVVPFPPGSGTDTGDRIIAQRLSVRWGQQVIVDNKGGAAGQIGADILGC